MADAAGVRALYARVQFLNIFESKRLHELLAGGQQGPGFIGLGSAPLSEEPTLVHRLGQIYEGARSPSAIIKNPRGERCSRNFSGSAIIGACTR